jgi:hypothetical protein
MLLQPWGFEASHHCQIPYLEQEGDTGAYRWQAQTIPTEFETL